MTPQLVIIKNMDAAVDWIVYSESVGATAGMQLNGSGAPYTYAAYFNNTAPTASVFSLGNYSGVNANTEDMMAYCFHSVEGYSLVGSYEGNGESTTNAPFVACGFRPAWVMIKGIGNSSRSWVVLDNKRPGYNKTDEYLYVDTNAASAVPNSTSGIDFLSNGFKIRSDQAQINGTETCIFLAFAESPFKTANAR